MWPVLPACVSSSRAHATALKIVTEDSHNAMHALITGGAGFIGSHLCEALLNSGNRVTVIDDLSTGRLNNVTALREYPDFNFVNHTVQDEIVLDRLVSQCDIVFHLAAAVGVRLIVENPVHTIETNIMSTHSLLKIASRYNVKVLIASTSEIYGKSTKLPFNEEDDRVLGPTTKSRWSYSSSKAVEEFLALSYNAQMGLPIVIVRLFNTIGPRQQGQYGMVVPRFVQQALSGEPITVFGDGLQSRCFCDVEDVVRGIINLAEWSDAVGQVFNIGSTNEVTILDLAKSVLDAADSMGSQSVNDHDRKEHLDRIGFVPYDVAYSPGFEDMQRRIPDTTKISAAIGWKPEIPLKESLRRIVEWHSTEAYSSDDRGAMVDPG